MDIMAYGEKLGVDVGRLKKYVELRLLTALNCYDIRDFLIEMNDKSIQAAGRVAYNWLYNRIKVILPDRAFVKYGKYVVVFLGKAIIIMLPKFPVLIDRRDFIRLLVYSIRGQKKKIRRWFHEVSPFIPDMRLIQVYFDFFDNFTVKINPNYDYVQRFVEKYSSNNYTQVLREYDYDVQVRFAKIELYKFAEFMVNYFENLRQGV